MIRYAARLAAQHVLSQPLVRPAYLAVQKHLTKSVTVTAPMVRQRADLALSYLDRLTRLGIEDLMTHGTILDLGAGWHFTIPLVYYRLGADAQVLLDLHRLADRAIVSATAAEVNALTLPGARRLIPLPQSEDFDRWLGRLGISYQVPDFVPFPVEHGSLRAIFCTEVLCYPDRPVVRAVFEEAVRTLAPGGVFVASAHLFDINALYDRGLSKFNMLRYSPEIWSRWFRPPITGMNRLRVSDFRELLYGLPLAPVVWEPEMPTADDLAEILQMPLASCFERYQPEDLACPHLFFVLQRT